MVKGLFFKKKVISFNESNDLVIALSLIYSNPYLIKSSSDLESFIQMIVTFLESLLSLSQKSEIELLRLGFKSSILLEGCPISFSDLPPSPTDTDDVPNVKDFVSEWFHLGVMGLLGQPIVNSQLKSGTVVSQICPQINSRMQTSSRGDAELSFHTDAAHDPDYPDFVGLLCLRGHEEAKTHFVSVDDLVSKLSESDLYQLQRNVFEIVPQNSYTSPTLKEVRILTTFESQWFIRLNDALDENGKHRTLTEDPEAKLALENLRNAMQNTESLSVTLKPGDLFIINNKRGVHKRDSFDSRNLGEKTIPESQVRWLQRIHALKRSIVPVGTNCILKKSVQLQELLSTIEIEN